jgi:hypothetical protein
MLTSFLPYFLLYPEIHYRFRFFKFSKYYVEEPEILIDMPYKTKSGKLPVYLIIKDADLFPVRLWAVKLHFVFGDGSLFTKTFMINELINDPLYVREFTFDFQDKKGFVNVSAEIAVYIKGSLKEIINDNFKEIPSFFEVYLSDNEELFDNYIQGDLHYHSFYTRDQVEFGAPVKAAAGCAKALGLDFFAVTDHSYDLDDKRDNYLENDPEIPNFNDMRSSCDELSDDELTIIPGEEVTVRNAKNRNVHLLVYDDEYFKGSGDGAERWLRTRSENSIEDVTSAIKDTSLAVAAHPFNKIPRLEYFLVKRGIWTAEDVLNNNIGHIQILNGEYDADFFTGLENWVQMLLAGNRVLITAGNDAHGNFNVFRQVKMPMFRLTSEKKQLFGKCRTVVFSSYRTKESILSAVKSGNMYITNGPHILLTVRDADRQYDLGSSFNAVSDNIEAELFVNSSDYSGHLRSVVIYKGNIGSIEEKVLWQQEFTDNIYSFNVTIPLQKAKTDHYIRIVVCTSFTLNNGQQLEHRAYSNPVWINK